MLDESSIYFNPRFPWGKRRHTWALPYLKMLISIHASRGGSDRRPPVVSRRQSYFNPRFPWGKRLFVGFGICYLLGFQSTLPVGEATVSCFRLNVSSFDISIHASRGGSDGLVRDISARIFPFQSTLPVGEATRINTSCVRAAGHFNPRFPWGKRLLIGFGAAAVRNISIHASRGGSD